MEHRSLHCPTLTPCSGRLRRGVGSECGAKRGSRSTHCRYKVCSACLGGPAIKGLIDKDHYSTLQGPFRLNCRMPDVLLSLKCRPMSDRIRHDAAVEGGTMAVVIRKRRTNSVTFDVDELEARRRLAGFTQKVLAAKAQIDPRTLQRALAGQPVRMDVGHGIAKALGAPVQALLRQDEEGPNTLLLWRCRDADEMLDVAGLAENFRFKIAVSPTEETGDALRAATDFFVDESDPIDPLHLHYVRDMLPRDWIKVAADLNKIIGTLEHHSVALYAASYESTDSSTYCLVVVARDSGTRRLERVPDKTQTD